MIHLEQVLKTSLQDVLKASWRCLEDVFARHLEDVLKTSLQDVLKMSWRRLKNVLKTSWGCLEDFFARRLGKTSWRGMTKTNILVFIKTSSEDVRVRWIYSSWSRRLLKTKDVFIKTNVCRVLSCFFFLSFFQKIGWFFS